MKIMNSIVQFVSATLKGAGLTAVLISIAHAEQPDFTGVWQNYSAGPGRGAARGAQLPFTPEARAKVEQYRRVIDGTNHSPGNYCVGTGMPGSMLGSGGYPMEIVQRPEQINVTYEAHGEMRRIYLGDRAIDPNEVFPERNGYSVGRWEGEALVVDTTRLVEQVDQIYAHSDQATIVERYTIATEADGRTVLTAVMTMTDPVFLTEPFTAEKKWQRVPNGRLQTYECNEPHWLDVLEELIREDDARQAESKQD
jgi:hypothetical protein